jgi:hypothetical protein
MLTFNAWMGQELTTTLVQVLMDQQKTIECIPMGSLSTVFQAEVMAILRCT